MVTGAIGIWAVYSFSFGKVNAWNINLPAPEFFDGVSFAMYHNSKGHAAYFMGQIRNTGWWYFFPVVLAVKTPLAWLAAVGFGLAVWWGKRAQLAYWMPVAFAAGILLPGMTSHVNIGVRHILPIFTALSILAGLGLLYLLERASRAKWAGRWPRCWCCGWRSRARCSIRIIFPISTNWRVPLRNGSCSTAISIGARTSSACNIDCANSAPRR